MIVPIVAMIVMMPVGLLITGQGDLRAGSGSTSVLWAVLAALAVAWLLLIPLALGQKVWFEEGWQETLVYDRGRLPLEGHGPGEKGWRGEVPAYRSRLVLTVVPEATSKTRLPGAASTSRSPLWVSTTTSPS